MKTYSTYQEAKIANPECDVFAYDGKFYTGREGDIYIDMKPAKPCNPANYCMTVEQF